MAKVSFPGGGTQVDSVGGCAAGYQPEVRNPRGGPGCFGEFGRGRRISMKTEKIWNSLIGVALGLALVLSPHQILAQGAGGTASINGFVHDSSGGVVSGA